MNNNITNASRQAVQTFHGIFVFPFGCLSEPDLGNINNYGKPSFDSGFSVLNFEQLSTI